MIERRPFNQPAGEDHGWLRAKRHISSADCHHATRVGRGSLRVWNDDEIAPNAGFSHHADVRARVLEGRQGSNTRLANDVMAASCLPRSTA
jgi:quercetin 2,3-dioxygenase